MLVRRAALAERDSLPLTASAALKSSRAKRRVTPAYRCRACRRDFTVKTGTVMHASNLSLGKWALAFYLFSASLKGVSSMRLDRDLGITQKAAWHMAHRIPRPGTALS